jgi:hypothetical protein
MEIRVLWRVTPCRFLYSATSLRLQYVTRRSITQRDRAAPDLMYTGATEKKHTFRKANILKTKKNELVTLETQSSNGNQTASLRTTQAVVKPDCIYLDPLSAILSTQFQISWSRIGYRRQVFRDRTVLFLVITQRAAVIVTDVSVQPIGPISGVSMGPIVVPKRR